MCAYTVRQCCYVEISEYASRYTCIPHLCCRVRPWDGKIGRWGSKSASSRVGKVSIR